MRKTTFFLVAGVVLFSCKNVTTIEEKNESVKKTAYKSIGMEINDIDVQSSEGMMKHYKGLKIGDTIATKMRAEIVKVCSKKGCWMTLDMMVKIK